MNELQKIVAIGLCGAVVSVVLKKDSPQIALLSSVVTCILIFNVVVSSLIEVISVVKEIFLKTNLDYGVVNTVLKICGIGIVCEYFCSIIEDSGETAIAKKMELGAKILIFAYTLPMITKVIDMIWSIF